MSVSGVSVITDHSCTDGDSPSAPCVPGGTQQPPALHNNPTCFPIGVSNRSRHSCGGLLRDVARDRAVRNWRVSEDHRPATSPPKTTKRHLPSSPDNSGYVRTLRLLAPLSAAPSLVAAPTLAVPSLLMALTRVASMASCAPPNSGRPSATTSRRRPSNP